MRADRVLELADRIEGLKHFDDFGGYEDGMEMLPALLPEQVGEDFFHMAWWQFQCHAPCCTAGWADFLWGDEDESTSLEGRARVALDLDWNTSRALFRPESPDGYFPYPAYINKLTPKVVAQALRHLAETGEVVFKP